MRIDVLDAFAEGARRSKLNGLSKMDPNLVQQIVSIAWKLMQPCSGNQLYLVFFGPKQERAMRSKGIGTTRSAGRGGGSAVDFQLDVDDVIQKNERSFCMVNRSTLEEVDLIADSECQTDALRGVTLADFTSIFCCERMRWATEKALSPGHWCLAAKCGSGELGEFFCDKRMDYILCSLEQLHSLGKNLRCEEAACSWFLHEQGDSVNLFQDRLDTHGVCTLEPLSIARRGFQLGVYPEEMHGINVIDLGVSFEYDEHGQCTKVCPAHTAEAKNSGIKTATSLRTDADYLLPYGAAMILELKMNCEPNTGAQIHYEK